MVGFNFTLTSPSLPGSSKLREKHDLSLGEKPQKDNGLQEDSTA